jgi:hypothetical protein
MTNGIRLTENESHFYEVIGPKSGKNEYISQKSRDGLTRMWIPGEEDNIKISQQPQAIFSFMEEEIIRQEDRMFYIKIKILGYRFKPKTIVDVKITKLGESKKPLGLIESPCSVHIFNLDPIAQEVCETKDHTELKITSVDMSMPSRNNEDERPRHIYTASLAKMKKLNVV